MSEKTIEQLKQEIAIAATTGDDNAFNSLIKEYNSRKAEVAKAMQAAAQKEAEALAGDREKLATAIHKSVMKIAGLAEDLAAVKATGFTFKVDSEGIVYKSVALAVPTIKVARTSTGTRNSSPTGNSLEADYQAYATDEDKAKIAAIENDLASGAIDTKTANSRKWVVKNAVRKTAIAEGKLQPIS
jgi:hypothetical protein